MPGKTLPYEVNLAPSSPTTQARPSRTRAKRKSTSSAATSQPTRTQDESLTNQPRKRGRPRKQTKKLESSPEPISFASLQEKSHTEIRVFIKTAEGCSRTTPVQWGRTSPKKSSRKSDTQARRRSPTSTCFRRRNPGLKFVAPNFDQDESDRFYVIEKLLDKRLDASGKEEYLVKWLNYGPTYNSWEPRAELEINAMDMIENFNNGVSPNSQKHCICGKNYKLDGAMIQCSNCNVWYHFQCLKMNTEEANAYLRYVCIDCCTENPELQCEFKPNKKILEVSYTTSPRKREQLGIKSDSD